MSSIGVRKRLWETNANVEPRDLAEAIRDLDGVARAIVPRRLITTDVTWVLPFTLAAMSAPEAILIVRVQTPSAPTIGLASLPDPMWTWKGAVAEVFRADGLTVGTRYIITWELIG
jgi:hypothetical protein